MKPAFRAFRLGLRTIVVSAAIASLTVALILAGPFPPAQFHLIAFADLLLTAILLSLPCVALGLVLIGLPADWLLRRLEARSRLAYGAFGLAGGLLCGLLLSLDGSVPAELLAWSGALYGLVTALVFRLVFQRFRPAADAL
jgi:hypothetical protein